MAEYPRRDKLTGVLRGVSTWADRCAYEREARTSELALLLGCPVDPRLGQRSRIGMYHSQPKNPCPNHKSRRV